MILSWRDAAGTSRPSRKRLREDGLAAGTGRGTEYQMMETETLPGRSLTPYQATIRELSDRLVQATRSIRVLDAVRWDGAVEDSFFSVGARSLPRVTRNYYADRPLAYDP